jgi:hydrogenase-4 membrane subunit HyfE
MHLSILLFGLSYFVAMDLPPVNPHGSVIASATAAISLLFTGLMMMMMMMLLMMMMTRRFALSQIVGFITLENGLYPFCSHPNGRITFNDRDGRFPERSCLFCA